MTALFERPSGGTVAARGRSPWELIRNAMGNLLRRIAYRIFVQIGYADVMNDINKLLGCLKHSSNFFVCDGHKVQCINESDANQIVTMYLRTVDFVP